MSFRVLVFWIACWGFVTVVTISLAYPFESCWNSHFSPILLHPWCYCHASCTWLHSSWCYCHASCSWTLFTFVWSGVLFAGNIEVSELNGTMRRTLISGITELTALVLDPSHGWVLQLWTAASLDRQSTGAKRFTSWPSLSRPGSASVHLRPNQLAFSLWLQFTVPERKE